MNRLKLLIVLMLALFISVRPEKQPTLGDNIRDHRRIHERTRISIDLILPGANVSNGWFIECVYCPKRIFSHSMLLDNKGLPHIVYGGDNLYYAWFDGGEWHYQTVDLGLHSVTSNSLWIDEQGYPHISVVKDGNLQYAYSNGESWNIQIVDSDGDINSQRIQYMDGNGYLHISYYDSIKNEWRYAHQEASGWVVHTLPYLSNYPTQSMVLDPMGYFHGCYNDPDRNGTYDTLIYAYLDQLGWQSEVVDIAGMIGLSCKITLDQDGKPHISYKTSSAGESLKYAYQSDTGWKTDKVETIYEEEVHGWTEPVFDGKGFPHLIYSTLTPLLKYGYKDMDGWHIQTVDDLFYESYSYLSLDLDSDGFPYMAYLYEKYTDNPPISSLKYAFWDNSEWHIEIVDREDPYKRTGSLVLDFEGYPHTSSYWWMEDDRYLVHEFRNKLGWNSQIVDTVECCASIGIDEDDYIHISYIENGLKYAFQDVNGWQTQLVDSEGMGPTSLVVDQFGNLHIAYIIQDQDFEGRHHIKYSRHDMYGWHYVKFDTSYYDSGGERYYIDLALDRYNLPHIVYSIDYNKIASPLMYGHWDGTEWKAQVVDENGGTSGSIAMDQNGYPHIAYRIGTDQNYTYLDSTGWHFQTVDSAYYNSPSMVLDGTGHPHISYSDLNYLKYAYWDFTDWHIQIVDDEGEVESFMALDREGGAHILYNWNYPYRNISSRISTYAYNQIKFVITYLPLVVK